MERVSLLETSSQQWKGRVSQNDASKFTISHKMATANGSSASLASNTRFSLITPDESSSTQFSTSSFSSSTHSNTNLLSGTNAAPKTALSPALDRKMKVPVPKVFKSKTGSCLPDLINSASNDPVKGKNFHNKDFARSVSIPAESSNGQSKLKLRMHF